VKKLVSSDSKEQECGKILADEILKDRKEIYKENEIRIKANRSVINKYSSKEDDFNNNPNKMSQSKYKHIYHLSNETRTL